MIALQKNKKRGVLALLFILTFCMPSFPQSESPRRVAALFDYDQRAPLDIETKKVEERNGVHLNDITYISPKGGRVPAYLVVPAGKGPFGAVIFLHHDKPNRSQFLDEAISLAQAGAVSLLIDAPFARPEPWRTNFDDSIDANSRLRIQTVIDLRRGIDLLMARRDVDAKRIAFVGHSYGQAIGGVLSGVEKRIRGYVLVAGAGSQIEFFTGSSASAKELRQVMTPEQFERFLSSLEPLEQIKYVKYASPAALFFQQARRDEFLTREQLMKYYRAASDPKMIMWYESEHYQIGFNAKARRDRAQWLRKQLGLRAFQRSS